MKVGEGEGKRIEEGRGRGIRGRWRITDKKKKKNHRIVKMASCKNWRRFLWL